MGGLLDNFTAWCIMITTWAGQYAPQVQPTKAGRLSAIFYVLGAAMGKLSIFVDESGDFGAYSSHCPYYIITDQFSAILLEQKCYKTQKNNRSMELFYAR